MKEENIFAAQIRFHEFFFRRVRVCVKIQREQFDGGATKKRGGATTAPIAATVNNGWKLHAEKNKRNSNTKMYQLNASTLNEQIESKQANEAYV